METRGGPRATLLLVDGEVDFERLEIRRRKGVSRLTPIEARLLQFLSANPGRVFTREQLLQQVWRYRPGIVSRAVDNTIRRLRAKIEAEPGPPRHLVTAHGAGYRFEPMVGQVGESGFFGRNRELDAIASAFADGIRLVTLVGPGGMGKARLTLVREEENLRAVHARYAERAPEIAVRVAIAL